MNIDSRTGAILINLRLNILKIAGSSLGRKHLLETSTGCFSPLQRAETRLKMSQAKIAKYLDENYPMFNKNHSEETRLKMSIIALKSEHNKGKNNSMFGKTGENNPFFGKTHSNEIRETISFILKSIPKTEEHKAKLRKPKTEEHKAKIGEENSKKIFVYTNDTSNILFKTFNSQIEASILNAVIALFLDIKIQGKFKKTFIF